MTAQSYLSIYKLPSKTQAPCISCQYKAVKNLIIHLKATLPYKNQLVKTNQPRRNYTTLYVSLTPRQAKKLANLAKKQGKTESTALRTILDAYFKVIEKRELSYEPYRKFSPMGLKVLPRTITIAHDRKLRETGRKISELAREAVEEFV